MSIIEMCTSFIQRSGSPFYPQFKILVDLTNAKRLQSYLNKHYWPQNIGNVFSLSSKAAKSPFESLCALEILVLFVRQALPFDIGFLPGRLGNG